MNHVQYLAEFLEWERKHPDEPFRDWPGLTRAVAGCIAREGALRAEVEAVSADKARLDWLEEHSYRAAPGVPPRVYVIAHSSVWPAGVPKQLRAAIDAACARIP